ncbi:hypothetical protein Tco_1264060, partial [Tanacetum coccineum]
IKNKPDLEGNSFTVRRKRYTKAIASQEGLSSIAAVVATMFISLTSFEGAMTTMFGRHAM